MDRSGLNNMDEDTINIMNEISVHPTFQNIMQKVSSHHINNNVSYDETQSVCEYNSAMISHPDDEMFFCATVDPNEVWAQPGFGGFSQQEFGDLAQHNIPSLLQCENISSAHLRIRDVPGRLNHLQIDNDEESNNPEMNGNTRIHKEAIGLERDIRNISHDHQYPFHTDNEDHASLFYSSTSNNKTCRAEAMKSESMVYHTPSRENTPFSVADQLSPEQSTIELEVFSPQYNNSRLSNSNNNLSSLSEDDSYIFGPSPYAHHRENNNSYSSALYSNPSSPDEPVQYSQNSLSQFSDDMPNEPCISTLLPINGLSLHFPQSPGASLPGAARATQGRRTKNSTTECKKRSQRMRLDGLSEEERHDRTRSQNNVASRTYREKKKERDQILEQEINQLERLKRINVDKIKNLTIEVERFRRMRPLE